ncbi:uncharacterized protein [Euphorbia lathyris]|uniref:uncharacterized protein isoform X1 n=1 Tax=Euphorbia lathyris TaxID=212925 RepID=UPI00331410C3
MQSLYTRGGQNWKRAMKLSKFISEAQKLRSLERERHGTSHFQFQNRALSMAKFIQKHTKSGQIEIDKGKQPFFRTDLKLVTGIMFGRPIIQSFSKMLSEYHREIYGVDLEVVDVLLDSCCQGQSLSPDGTQCSQWFHVNFKANVKDDDDGDYVKLYFAELVVFKFRFIPFCHVVASLPIDLNACGNSCTCLLSNPCPGICHPSLDVFDDKLFRSARSIPLHVVAFEMLQYITSNKSRQEDPTWVFLSRPSFRGPMNTCDPIRGTPPYVEEGERGGSGGATTWMEEAKEYPYECSLKDIHISNRMKETPAPSRGGPFISNDMDIPNQRNGTPVSTEEGGRVGRGGGVFTCVEEGKEYLYQRQVSRDITKDLHIPHHKNGTSASIEEGERGGSGGAIICMEEAKEYLCRSKETNKMPRDIPVPKKIMLLEGKRNTKLVQRSELALQMAKRIENYGKPRPDRNLQVETFLKLLPACYRQKYGGDLEAINDLKIQESSYCERRRAAKWFHMNFSAKLKLDDGSDSLSHYFAEVVKISVAYPPIHPSSYYMTVCVAVDQNDPAGNYSTCGMCNNHDVQICHPSPGLYDSEKDPSKFPFWKKAEVFLRKKFPLDYTTRDYGNPVAV